MGHQCVHPQLVSPVKGLSSLRCEGNGLTNHQEVVWRHHAVVNSLNDARIGNQRTKRFHQVQSECGSSKARLVIEPQHRVKAHRITSNSEVLGQGQTRSTERASARWRLPCARIQSRGRIRHRPATLFPTTCTVSPRTRPGKGNCTSSSIRVNRPECCTRCSSPPRPLRTLFVLSSGRVLPSTSPKHFLTCGCAGLRSACYLVEGPKPLLAKSKSIKMAFRLIAGAFRSTAT